MNKQNKGNLIIFLIIISLSILYFVYREHEFKNKGRTVVCKAIRLEGAAHGSSLYILIYFNDTVYSNIADNLCSQCIGKYYFARIISDDPTGPVKFFENSPVPECILKKPLPSDGWSKIPKCDNLN